MIHLVNRLCKEYGAKAISGNHESNFLKWLKYPEDKWFKEWTYDETILEVNDEAINSKSIWFYTNGGDKTINSFYKEHQAYKKTPSHHAKYIIDCFPEEVNFIKNLPNFIEWNNYVFVHAGVNLKKKNWKDTSSYDFQRIRKPFHNKVNKTGKIFVFGHQRTEFLNNDKSSNIWISPCKTKIGIDGGAVYGNLLHGLIIKDGNYSTFSTDKNGNTFFSKY